jgi:opacity protein-like surface antigen
MKKLLIVLFLTFLALNSLVAQDTRVKQNAGDFGLMFDLSGLANLGFNAIGGGNDSISFAPSLGAKWFLADKLALRILLGFQSTTLTTPVTVGTVKSESKLTQTAFTVAPAIVYNVASSGPVAGYVGGGIQFLTASTSPTNADTASSTIKMSNTSFGIGALFGAEWFPWSNLSLSGEYSLSFSTSSGTTTITIIGKSTETDLPTTSFIGIAGRGTINATLYF